MGCVHTHWGIPTIEGWGNPSCVQNVLEKIGEDNWNARKISRNVNQTLALELEHDKIQSWWALDILSYSMLERVWWCRCSKMEFWSLTICCPMNYSNGGKYT
jgi:hypothetical protein